MNKDNLQILFELLGLKENISEKSLEKALSNVCDFLENLRYTPQAFEHAYAQVPEQHIKKILETHKNFAIICANVFSRLTEDKFNHYFLKDLHSYLDMPIIRNFAIHNKTNKMLQTFVDQHDKPKNLDELMKSLYQCHSDKKRFHKIINDNQTLLLKLNKLTGKTSKALSNLSDLFRSASVSKGFEGIVQLAEQLKFNLTERSFYLPYKLDQYREKYDYLSINNIAVLERLLAPIPIHEQFQTIRNFFYHSDPIEVINALIEKNHSSETIMTYWKRIEYFIDQHLSNEDYTYYTSNSEPTSFSKLQTIMCERTIKNKFIGFNGHDSYYKKDILLVVKKLEKDINKHHLYHTIDNNLAEKNQTKNKFKI